MVFFYILAGGRNKAQKRGNLRNYNKYRRKVEQRKRYVGKLTHIGSRNHNIRRLNENLRIYKGAVVSLLVQEAGDTGSFLIDKRNF